MEKINSKLQIGDVFVINSDEFFGIKGGRYKVVGFAKNRLGADMYKFQSDRKNAVTTHKLYVKDIDHGLYVPTFDYLTNTLGMMFLNGKTIIKYDKELIAKAKKFNSM